MKDIIQKALKALEKGWGLIPRVLRPHAGGRVNQTFYVRDKNRAYALQLLSPAFGDDGAAAENAAEAALCLIKAGLRAPRVELTLEGSPWFRCGGVWKLSQWLEGGPPPPRGIETAIQCSSLLARFHGALLAQRPAFTAVRKAEHNNPEDLAQPESALADAIVGYQGHAFFPVVRAGLARALGLAQTLGRVEFESWGVRHGDPKLENFIFDSRGRVRAIIDLDTVGYGHLGWDLADGLRSWAGVRHPVSHLVELDPAIWEAGLAAYHKGGPGLLSEGDIEKIPAAVMAVSLNLARRYLVDAMERNYFAWDRVHYDSLETQNLLRAQGMIELAGQVRRFAGLA